MSHDRDWQDYERQIHERLRRVAGDQAEIEFNVELPGRFSGVARQVDILVRGSFANIGEATMAVDCKCFSRPVDVKSVELVMGLVDDVGTDLGLLVTTEGFSAAAQNRAKGARGFQLEVVPYEELEDWEPDLVWCAACTDPASDRYPGGVYLQPVNVQDAADSGLVVDAGMCDRCDAVHMRCECGTLNSALESDHGSWLECDGGCGREWRVDFEVDRKGLPLSDELSQSIRVR